MSDQPPSSQNESMSYEVVKEALEEEGYQFDSQEVEGGTCVYVTKEGSDD